jgi:DNA-binding Lrp family transcriptional regulator
MAAHTIAQIFSRVQTSAAESKILQTIAYRANIQGQNARISYEALAAATDFSERWVKELVRRLEARHLLRVHRQRIGYDRWAINTYSIVRPWLRELNYAQAYRSKQERVASAQMSRDGEAHQNPIRGENKEQTPCPTPTGSPFCSPDEAIKAGLSPGSLAFNAAIGQPLEPG